MLLKDEYNNFRGGSYFVTTPKEEMYTLYKLHGGCASQCGQYYTLERRSGNEGYRHDMAVERIRYKMKIYYWFQKEQCCMKALLDHSSTTLAVDGKYSFRLM